MDSLRYDFKEQPSGEPGQGVAYTLSHGASGIACHGDRTVLQEWKNTFENMLQLDDWTGQAKDLVGRHENLKELARPMREVLRKEIERGTFDGGRCELCP